MQQPVPGVSGGAFFWNAMLFTRALRASGLRTDLGAAIDYSRALTLIDIGEREQVHAAGLALFVRRRDELPVYDEVFSRFWRRYELAIEPPDLDLELPWDERAGEGQRMAALRQGEAAEQEAPDAVVVGDQAEDLAGPSDLRDETSAAASWSELERLFHKPFERMSPSELRDAERLVDELRPRLEMRRSRRHGLHPHGRRLAARQMFRRNLQNGGDLAEWLWRRRACAPAP